MHLLNTGLKRRGAFTLIETVTVAGIIGIVAAIGFPSFVHARTNSAKSSCLNNLREIDDAKQEWAIENNKVNGDTPSPSDLVPYLRNRRFPKCPADGVYTVSDVGSVSACNVSGHRF